MKNQEKSTKKIERKDGNRAASLGKRITKSKTKWKIYAGSGFLLLAVSVLSCLALAWALLPQGWNGGMGWRVQGQVGRVGFWWSGDFYGRGQGGRGQWTEIGVLL